MTKNFSEIAEEACNCDEMIKAVEKHTKALKRELETIRNKKLEATIHKNPLAAAAADAAASAAASTGQSQASSDIGSGASNTQTQVRNPPQSITKGRPKKTRYKSGLEIQANHKKPEPKKTRKSSASASGNEQQ